MRFHGLLAVICFAFSSAALAEDLASVNGTPITRESLMKELQANPDLAKQADADKKLLEKLINGELLVQAAKKLDLENDPQVQKEIAGMLRQVLANAATNRYLAQKPISDDEIRAKYDELVKQADKTEYHARHILVPNESEALALKKRLAGGEDFARLAGELSQDKANASNGGDLGWFLPSTMVKAFADALQQMKPGEVSAPVHTQFGWHVVELLGSRPASLPTLEQARGNVARILASQRIDEYIAELRTKADIKSLQP